MENKYEGMIKDLVKDLVNCQSKCELLGKMECIKHLIILDMEKNLKVK